MIKNILFDLDGTLINTKQKEFNDKYYQTFYKKFVNVDEEIDTIFAVVLQSLTIMLNNDGKSTNEKVLWEFLEEKLNKYNINVQDIFNDYYHNEYDSLVTCVEKIKGIGEAIYSLKEKGYNLILATNPLFPKIAIEKRANWGDIDCSCFSYITSYENSSYCKPNINYYKEIIDKNNLNIQETFMFGNDLIEDLIIENLNIPCYIITNNALHFENINNCTKKGDYNDFFDFINNLPDLN